MHSEGKEHNLRRAKLISSTRLICFQRIRLQFSKSGQKFYPVVKRQIRSLISWNTHREKGDT